MLGRAAARTYIGIGVAIGVFISVVILALLVLACVLVSAYVAGAGSTEETQEEGAPE